MADGWEAKHKCLCRSTAILKGFTRAFDKPSIKMRGSRENPAPTLRIVESPGECNGVAFEFKDEVREAVMNELTKREGRNFPFRSHVVRLADSREVTALTPIYEGNDILEHDSFAELAQLSIKAKGEQGNGVQYVRDVASHLVNAGVSDLAVSKLLAEIERQLEMQRSPAVSNSSQTTS